MIRTLPTRQRRASGFDREGFTFVEVLFAIIILGIGMIMIAGILPVAIKQQSDTRDDMAGKAVCEAGFAYLSTIVQTNPEAFIPTNYTDSSTSTPQGNFSGIGALNTLLGANAGDRAGKVIPLNYQVTIDNRLYNDGNGPYNAFNKILNSRVLESDPRYQYMAFYRRDEDSPTVRIIVLAMKLNNTDATKAYGLDKTTNESTLRKEAVNANSGPFLLDVEIENQKLEPDRITFSTASQDISMLGEGAFVIIADSPAKSPDIQRPFRNNGRVFQLGQQRLDLNANGRVWDLASAYDLDLASTGPDGVDNTADDVADGSMTRSGSYPIGTSTAGGTVAKAWVVGRGLARPMEDFASNNKYNGRVQDISVLVADVPIR